MVDPPLEQLAALGAVDVNQADALRCSALLVDVRMVLGWLDSYRAAVTARIDELAAAGESFGSEQSHARCSFGRVARSRQGARSGAVRAIRERPRAAAREGVTITPPRVPLHPSRARPQIVAPPAAARWRVSVRWLSARCR